MPSSFAYYLNAVRAVKESPPNAGVQEITPILDTKSPMEFAAVVACGSDLQPPRAQPPQEVLDLIERLSSTGCGVINGQG